MKDEKYLYRLKNVSFSYQLGAHRTQALKNINTEIPLSQFVALSGPSGSGKSTLLNLLGLIEPMQEGEMFFHEEEIAKMTEAKMNQIRKYKIGFIFQQFHLIPVLNAEENVLYFLNRQGLSKDESMKRTRESLEAVGLWTHRMKKPSELSGGQRQRVAIARAMAKQPDVIIGDEPTASLDQKTGKEIMDIFSSLVKETGISVIVTTHDKMVQTYADLNIQIQDGTIVYTETY